MRQICFFISIPLALISSRSQADPKAFESIKEVDLNYFLNPPKLPWGVDPFLKSPGFALMPPADEKFVLNGVFYSRTSPMAIVNGKSVKIGDMVGDRQVEEIGENFVILRRDDSELEINLPPVAGHPKKAEIKADDLELEE